MEHKTQPIIKVGKFERNWSIVLGIICVVQIILYFLNILKIDPIGFFIVTWILSIGGIWMIRWGMIVLINYGFRWEAPFFLIVGCGIFLFVLGMLIPPIFPIFAHLGLQIFMSVLLVFAYQGIIKRETLMPKLHVPVRGKVAVITGLFWLTLYILFTYSSWGVFGDETMTALKALG